MCGILTFIGNFAVDFNNKKENYKHIIDLIKNRGPDAFNTVQVNDMIVMVGAILHLRGIEIVTQPLQDSLGNVLLWNGEIYDGLDVDDSSNDTLILSNTLQTSSNIIETFSLLQGEFAFTYYKKSENCLYFGRDRIGRRSLLISPPLSQIRSNSIIISSIADRKLGEWEELNPNCIYKLNLNENKIEYIEWNINPTINPLISLDKPYPIILLELLYKSVYKRVNNIPFNKPINDKFKPSRVAVLFSGGIDCTILTVLIHYILPINEPIDLLNICFDKDHQSPDRLTGINSFNELKMLFPKREFRLIYINKSYEKDVIMNKNHILELCFPQNSNMDFTIGSALHYSSSRSGYLSLTDLNMKKVDITEEEEEISSFSTVLSHLLPIPTFSLKEIEKSNKKIEKNIPCSQPKCKRIGNINCSLKSCKKCCIGLHKKAELLMEGKDISKMYLNVCSLEEANNIISIENLAKGYCKYHKVGNEIAYIEEERRKEEEMRLNIEKNKIEYKSEAKVLIDGLGADELFYGYLRHRMKYEKEGIESMKNEVELDINRLWKRNLGRDDRCMSDNGVEIRFPYLDENIIQFSRSAPVEEIVDMNLPKGYGDKMILRKIGVMLGLNGIFNLEKRAIQFGSRIAKETSFNEFGKSCRNISGDVKIEMDEDNDE